MNEFLHENHQALEDLRKHIQELKNRLVKNGDLKELVVETLTNEDVELWKDYEKFIDLLQSAVDKNDVGDLKGAVDYLYDKVINAKSSLFRSFIGNRLTSIRACSQMIALNKYEHRAYELWSNIKEQLEFARKNIISIS